MTFTNTDCVRYEINRHFYHQAYGELHGEVDVQVFLIYPIRYKILKEINK
jgi:hypothetical protein